MARYTVITFGCQMNAHDSDRIGEVLRGAGHQEAAGLDDADLVLLNTCSIREKAEQKLRSEVGRLAVLKRQRPGLTIAVAGCVAQQEGEGLLRRMPDIDLLLGPDNIPELPRLLLEAEVASQAVVRTQFDLDAPHFLAATAEVGRTPVSAFVTVMKGCNERCTYCIVPHTRGPERYRASREIIDEVTRLVDAGAREITLLGQTVNSYRDPLSELPVAPGAGEAPWQHTRGLRAREDESEFAAALRAISAQVPGLLRLRYTSPHPRHLTVSLIRAHQDLPVLARHVHLPVQAGSDRVLRRMLRRYSAAEYEERVQALREAVPGVSLATDMIVGFPGETAEDFAETLALVRRVGFTIIYGFKYSERPYTAAVNLGDDIPESVKAERLAQLIALGDGMRTDLMREQVGSNQSVLFEGRGKTGALRGRTERSEIVHAAGPDRLIGKLYDVVITGSFRNSLLGEVSGVPAEGPAPRATAAAAAFPAQLAGTVVIIRAFKDKIPKIAATAFIAEGVIIVGDVEIGEHASIWYNAVLRADVGMIRIGARSNVQDGSCVHMTSDLSHALIGEEATVGHNAIVHGATVHDGCLIGMGSILLDNAVIGTESLVAAGSVVPPRMIVPPYSMVRGTPGKVVRELSEHERLEGRRGAAHYVELAREHAQSLLGTIAKTRPAP